MHELSIAQNIFEIVNNHLQEFPNCKVYSIRLKIGNLSCVHRDALQFSLEMITANTLLQGVRLIIDEMPVIIYCPTCDELQELPGIQLFQCPKCGTMSSDIRQGKELEVETIELIDDPASRCTSLVSVLAETTKNS